MLHVNHGGRDLLLVASFFDHAVAVFDVTPAEPIFFNRIATLASDETEPATRGQ